MTAARKRRAPRFRGRSISRNTEPYHCGWCGLYHVTTQRTKNTALECIATEASMIDRERFMKKVRIVPGPMSTPCWVFIGKTDRGYGRFDLDGKKQRAHIVAYRTWKGEVPDGLVLDHPLPQSRVLEPRAPRAGHECA